MNVEAKRLELAGWILETEEEILEEITQIMEKSSVVVCKTVAGELLTADKYKQKLIEAEERINSGEFTTHEDLLKEMQNW